MISFFRSFKKKTFFLCENFFTYSSKMEKSKSMEKPQTPKTPRLEPLPTPNTPNDDFTLA
jgi:hypothetical protein